MTFSLNTIAVDEDIDSQQIEANVKQKYKEWKGLRKLNQKLDVGINLSTIFLGLAIAVLSAEAIPMNDSLRKGGIGIIGGFISFSQAISTKFGIRKKAEGYRLVESKVMILANNLNIASDNQKLLEIHHQPNALILDAAGLERGD